MENVEDDFDHGNFLNYMNSHYPQIQFTCETQKDSVFNFLDISITMDIEGKVHTKVFRKPTHTNLYSHFKTNADHKVKIGLIETLARRGVNLCSRKQDLVANLNIWKKCL